MAKYEISGSEKVFYQPAIIEAESKEEAIEIYTREVDYQDVLDSNDFECEVELTEQED